MKTEKEIELKKREDIEFIISAVTNRLLDEVRFEYSRILDHNGYRWFYDECVTITHRIMFDEGSAYLQWLEGWKIGKEPDFHELTNECFDWYHMDKALENWERKYGGEKDEEKTIFKNKAEWIGHMIHDEGMFGGSELMSKALAFSNKLEEKKIERKKELIEKVVEKLNESQVEDVEKVLQKLNNKKED
jgi:hypothetical protein